MNETHRAILGCLIAQQQTINLVANDFPKGQYRVIYKALVKLGGYGGLVDLLDELHHTLYTLVIDLYWIGCPLETLQIHIDHVKQQSRKANMFKMMQNSRFMTADELQKAFLSI